jgi:hypothetical protein
MLQSETRVCAAESCLRSYIGLVYYINQSPVAKSGDCASTGGHLDPFNLGDDCPCSATEPQECQVGDLSGKHGAMAGPNVAVT